MTQKPRKSAEFQRQRNAAKVRAFRARQNPGEIAVERLAQPPSVRSGGRACHSYVLWTASDGSRGGAVFRAGEPAPVPAGAVLEHNRMVSVPVSHALARGALAAWLNHQL